MAAIAGRLGAEGAVVRSDDVEGNQVRGVASTAGGERRFTAEFTDDGEVIACSVEA